MGDIKVLIISTGHNKPIKIVHESGIKENSMANIEDLANQVSPYNSNSYAYMCEDYNNFSVLCLSCGYPNSIACCKKTDRKRVFDYFDEINKIIDNMTEEEFEKLITESRLTKGDENGEK